ncbi:MAG: 30S ribosomal protein S6 [Desulfomicrobium escambiense]|nr:30S ribosomal protein S6 [Desulfomicrobium escambiense]
MNIYENFVIFSASLSDDEIKAGIEKNIGSHQERRRGTLKVDIWGKRARL